MFVRSICIFLMCICFFSAYTQKIDTVKSHTISLPYTLLKIGTAKEKEKMPVILFLHGAGERGRDNSIQITVGLPQLIHSIKKTHHFPCIIVAPQCPTDDKWVDTDWASLSHQMAFSMTKSLSGAIELLDSIIKINPAVDLNRIYVTGISMGGFGTWELLQRYPNKFAAAIPICGGGDTSQVSQIKRCPIWAFHGKKDKLVKVSRTIDMYNKLSEINGGVKLSILEKEGHLCWNSVYKNENVVNWLFSNSNREK